MHVAQFPGITAGVNVRSLFLIVFSYSVKTELTGLVRTLVPEPSTLAVRGVFVSVCQLSWRLLSFPLISVGVRMQSM